MSNPNHSTLPMQPFLLYTQSKVPNFTVDATNQAVIASLLAYFCKNDVQSKQGYQRSEGLIADWPFRLR